MAFATSIDSPIALLFVRLINNTSSNAFETHRNPMAVPTLPLPMIEINYPTFCYFTIITEQLVFWELEQEYFGITLIGVFFTYAFFLTIMIMLD